MYFQQWRDMFGELLNVYRKFDAELEHTLENTTETEEELLEIEQELGVPIPPSLRETFLKFSSKFELFVYLGDNFSDQMPHNLREIGLAHFNISVDELLSAEADRKGWAKACFNNQEDEYDKVWHNKLGFMNVGNGDVIAFDLCDEKEDKRVVYLSHEDSPEHGYILGESFCDFFTNYLKIGACGTECWSLAAFIENSTSGINPNCDNAKMYRKIIGLPQSF